MQSTLRHNHIVTCCCRFTVSLLVEAFPRLKCIIDLTNTDRYYDEKVSRINVDSRRIFPPIHVITMSIKNATSRSSIRVFSSFGNWNREIPLLSSLRSLTAFLDRADIRELVAPLHWSRLIFVHLSFLFLSFLLPLTRSFARLRFPFLFSLFFFFSLHPLFLSREPNVTSASALSVWALFGILKLKISRVGQFVPRIEG